MDEKDLGCRVIARITLPLGLLAIWPTAIGLVVAALCFILLPRLLLIFDSQQSLERDSKVSDEAPLLASLLSAHLASGAPLREALQSVSRALQSDLSALTDQVAVRLTNGERDPFAPWRQVPALQGLADSCSRAVRTGASISNAASRVAERLRKEQFHQRQAQLERAVIRMTLPTGLCLLPAFVATVVIPMAYTLFQGINF